MLDICDIYFCAVASCFQPAQKENFGSGTNFCNDFNLSQHEYNLKVSKCEYNPVLNLQGFSTSCICPVLTIFSECHAQ